MILLLLYPVVTILWNFIHWWRHKGWTLKDVWNSGRDKLERSAERRREKKHSHRERDVLEELERELEEDPYADSEFTWLTDELTDGTKPADPAETAPEELEEGNTAETDSFDTEEAEVTEATEEQRIEKGEGE